MCEERVGVRLANSNCGGLELGLEPPELELGPELPGVVRLCKLASPVDFACLPGRAALRAAI